MEKIRKDIEANWKGRRVVFRGLEAWVCKTCGEQAYEADDARLMQNLIRATELDADQPDVMNVEEVADLLRVSNQTVYSPVSYTHLDVYKRQVHNSPWCSI